MELYLINTMISTICILLSSGSLVTPASSATMRMQNGDYLLLLHPSYVGEAIIPRKLMLMRHLKEDAALPARVHHASMEPFSSSYNKHKTELDASAGYKPNDEQEEDQSHDHDQAGDESSEFFTMDYKGIRRRRPIHNMSGQQRP